MRYLMLAAAGALAASPVFAADQAPTTEELYEIIQAQQEQIDNLVGKRQNVSEGSTSIGGYGELHYNNYDSGSQFDFHRFVLFFNHEFNDDIRFFSELELEHSLAGEGKPGEIELEQAYAEFDLSDKVAAKAGLFLMPVGILNETHEPNTFYGVERNPIEKNLIPSTWWEGGIGATGNFGASGISWDLNVHSGLEVGADFNIRSGRQKVAKANGEEIAYSGRLKYTGIAGLEVAASFFHQGDITQDLVPNAGAGTLLETHVRWNNGPLTLTALYADWTLDGSAAESLNKEKQWGGYGEASWRFNEAFGVFARHNIWNNGGFGDTQQTQTNIGVNYWPHKNVVLKFDLQQRDENNEANEGFNLGFGYQF